MAASAPPSDTLDRRLRLGTALAAVLWPLGWILGGAGSGVADIVGTALIGGLLVVIPLAVLLSREPDRDGLDSRAFRWAVGSLLVSVPTGLLSMLGSPGALSASLAVPWLVTTLLVGLWGLVRLGRRPHLDLPENCIDVGLLSLPVAGVWLVASRAGQPLLGFTEPWVSLTATHFHYAALGVPVMAGVVGRALPSLEREGREAVGVVGGWRIVGWLAILGPALTAAGIAWSPVLELLGAVVMSGAAVGVGAYLVLLAAGSSLPRASRRLFWVAGPLPVLTAALAMLFALSQLLESGGFPDFAVMARFHGLVNALGFVAAGMAGLALARLGPERRPGIPFSRLRGGRFVGRWYFRSLGLVDEGAPPPAGLVDTLDVFARDGVDGLHPLRTAEVHPLVRRFYEETGRFRVDVTAEWRFPASWVAPLWRGLARSLGQLELPTDPVGDRGMDGELLALRDAPDGRTDVRGWVRLHRGTDRPVFVAAYSHHRHEGVGYANIAMPLPGGNLASILRVDPGTLGGLVYTTRRTRGFAGDEGIFYVSRLGALRLPMHETLVVGPAAGREGELAAHHEIHVLGRVALRLHYHLRFEG